MKTVWPTPLTTGRSMAEGSRAPLHRAAARGTDPIATHGKPAEALLLPADLLGGDESIIFAIKPSLWFIVFDSANWAIAALCLIACGTWVADHVTLTEARFISAVLTMFALRLGLALLRWVSRFYVLTNRRVMRLRGILKPNVFECPLVQIRNTALTADFPESLTQLGTIHFIIADPEDRLGSWRNVANPRYVHAEVRKAIERAIDSQPRL